MKTVSTVPGSAIALSTSLGSTAYITESERPLFFSLLICRNENIEHQVYSGSAGNGTWLLASACDAVFIVLGNQLRRQKPVFIKDPRTCSPHCHICVRPSEVLITLTETQWAQVEQMPCGFHRQRKLTVTSSYFPFHLIFSPYTSALLKIFPPQASYLPLCSPVLVLL